MITKKILRILCGIIIVGLFIYIIYCFFGSIAIHKYYISPYPYGKNFAFTITDDPDGAKLEKIKPIYELLNKLGFRTTIACWVFKPKDVENLPDPQDQLASDTLEDIKYLEFIKGFHKKGFEIALHTVTAGHDKRDVTIQGYNKYKELFGYYPKINIMHSRNKENIYWGKNVFQNRLMKMLVGLYSKDTYSGENKDSEYFWGDICKEKTKYIRLWGTSNINTLKFNPSMPYSDGNTPYVNYWFSFSDGYTGKYFKKMVSIKNIDRLVKERGISIVYTHLASGFTKRQKDGSYVVDKTVQEELEYLSIKQDGWFAPTSEILDRLLAMKNVNLKEEYCSLVIFNSNQYDVPGVTLIAKPENNYYDIFGNVYKANSEGEIIIDNLKAGNAVTLFENKGKEVIFDQKLPILERIRLVLGKMKIMIFSHRG